MTKGLVRPWMSEFWTLVLGLPILIAFFPHGDQVVLRGFTAIKAAPAWFEWSIGAAISLAFGIRGAASVAQGLANGRTTPPPATTPAQGAGPTGANDIG